MLEDRSAQGNTVGSRSQTQEADLAYIAGFLDGDGSVMMQVKKRSDTVRGYRLMATICFYQDARHDAPLEWIQRTLGSGYLSRRKDGITELRIQGFRAVGAALAKLEPYVRFKQRQIVIMRRMIAVIGNRDVFTLVKRDRRKIVQDIRRLRQENYHSSQRRTTDTDLDRIFGLTNA